MVNLNDVLPLLPRLSRVDLVAVRAAADRLLGAPAPTAGPLYDALLAAAGVKMPWAKFQRTRAHKAWDAGEKLIIEFVDDTWGVPNRVTKHALMAFLIQMLADDLKRRRVPVSVGSLALNLPSVPQVFDTQFPGYRQDGLAHAVLQAMVRK